jgi:hypothetical protein
VEAARSAGRTTYIRTIESLPGVGRREPTATDVGLERSEQYTEQRWRGVRDVVNFSIINSRKGPGQERACSGYSFLLQPSRYD